MKIKYNGKEYKKIEDVLTDSIIMSTKDHFKKALKPFEKEIAEHKGIVTVNIPKNFNNANIEVSNIPNDLKERIIQHLQ